MEGCDIDNETDDGGFGCSRLVFRRFDKAPSMYWALWILIPKKVVRNSAGNCSWL